MYQRTFTSSNIGVVHREFGEILALARKVDTERRALGLPPSTAATQRIIRQAYLKFNERLDAHAATTAAKATAEIRARLRATQRRQDTRNAPHLSGGVRSRALHRFGGLATGEVGVADEDELDKIVNPTSPQYGPYWRAQEFGTGGGGVPSQLGRVIRGYFYGPGLTDPTPPRSIYAGGGGPHPIFVSAKAQRAIYGSLGFSGGGGARGGVGGYGTIEHEIQARHFIRDGANRAEAEWRRGMAQIESDAIRSLAPVATPAAFLGRRRRP